MTTSQKGFATPLLIALVAVLLIGGGAYAYVQNKQTPPVATTQTSDLKTYTNTEYGFSFQYPSSFGIPKEHISTPSEKLKNNPDSVSFLDSRLVISSGISYNGTTGQPMTFAEETAGGSNKKQITVDGRSGIQVSSPQIGTVTSIPLSDNVIIIIEGSPDLQNQILPTFKFSPNSQSQSAKTMSVPTITSIATSTDHGSVNIVISGSNFIDWATVEYLNNGNRVETFCGYLGNNGELTHSWSQPEGGWPYYSNINQLRVVNADCRTADIKSGLTGYPSVTASISMVRNLPTLK